MKQKVGLILEGGGMRGVYTAGVLDGFLDENIEFDGVLGVSAGSCHGASYLAKQRKRAFRVNVDYLQDWRYCSVRSLILTGDMFGAKMLYDTIPNEYDPFDFETFDKYSGWFRAVVTNIETGEAEYPLLKDMKNDVQWIRASSSLPLLSRVVEIGGKKYLDGGISDSVPLQQAINLNLEKNVIILTQCPSYRKSANSLMPLLRIKYHHYPNLLEKLENRHLRYNETLDQIEKLKALGKVVVIQPQQPVTIGRIEKNRDKLTALYLQGVNDGRSHAEEIRSFQKG